MNKLTDEEFNQELRDLVRAFKIYQDGISDLSYASGFTQSELSDMVNHLVDNLK